jgi:hypothetical protein
MAMFGARPMLEARSRDGKTGKGNQPWFDNQRRLRTLLAELEALSLSLSLSLGIAGDRVRRVVSAMVLTCHSAS